MTESNVATCRLVAPRFFNRLIVGISNFSGIILGFFSVLWFLIKVGAVIAAVIFIYQKFKSKKGEGDIKIEEGK